MRRCERLDVESMRKGKGRLKKYYGEAIRHNITQLHITEERTLDRKMWRSCIKVKG